MEFMSFGGKNKKSLLEKIEDIEYGVKDLEINVPPHNDYLLKLISLSSFYQLNEGFYALRDCDAKGNLKSALEWVFLYSLVFHDKDEQNCKVLICDCKSYASQREVLEATHVTLTIPSARFYKDQVKKYCIHAIALDALLDQNLVNEPMNSDVIHLSIRPYLACAVQDGDKYWIVSRGRSDFKCSCKVIECEHIRSYLSFCSENDIEIPDFDKSGMVDDEYKCKSLVKIPYPLTEELRATYSSYQERKREFPLECIPKESKESCEHGNLFDSRCPVKNKWIKTSTGVIYTQGATLKEICIYYRPTLHKKCMCQLAYDGQNDLLFNLDDKHLFYYGLLFHIMHTMQHCQYSLKAAVSTDEMSRQRLGTSKDSIPYHQMRKAYNAFIRLLNLDYWDLFHCQRCVENIENKEGMVIVMDGIMMGSRRDLYPSLDHSDTKTTKIKGSPYKERMLVASTKGRRLLAEYCGLVHGKYISSAPNINIEDFRILLDILRKECPSLYKVVKSEGQTLSPGLRRFIGEFSKQSPACGIFQFCGDTETKKLLNKVVKGTLHLKDTQSLKELEQLQRRVPLMVEGILEVERNGRIGEMTELIQDIIKAVNIPATKYRLPSKTQYALAEDERYDVFPCFPRLKVRPSYEADKQKGDLEEGCRKKTSTHYSLSPGIFTMFCEHQVCLGFSLMQQAESPQTPFDILVERFPQEIIDNVTLVYDNCCKLHNYICHREPKRFSKSRFMIDRLHFNCNHTSCSIGYSLDTYKGNSRYVNLNSQMNEQANSELRYLSKQVTYMTPTNVMQHVALFLGLRNMRKKSGY